LFGTTLSGATEALNTVEALTISFIVFTFGSMLVAIPVASRGFSPCAPTRVPRIGRSLNTVESVGTHA
jgi:uncharacterized membrane protein